MPFSFCDISQAGPIPYVTSHFVQLHNIPSTKPHLLRHKATFLQNRQNTLIQYIVHCSSQSTPQPRKRKHEDATSALQFKKQKTENSKIKLERHLEQKTCPNSLQYKAKANVTPDETFQQEISAIKSHAEEQFVSALVRYHQRRLISHNKKLKKANTA